MPLYNYTGYATSGKKVTGTLDAANKQVLREQLQKKGIILSVCSEKSQLAKGEKASILKKFNLGQSVSKQEIKDFTSQFAALQRADIPLVECLSALLEQMENETFRTVLSDVKTKVCEGASLASALGDHPKIFDTLYISMIKAGESSGSLNVVLERLTDILESQQRLKSKIIGAMVYPLIMVCVGGILLIVIFVFVIPRVTKMFEQQQKTLPGITQFLLDVAYVLSNYWMLIIPAILGLAYLFNMWIHSKSGRLKWDAFKIKVPIFGPVFRLVSISRFAKTLATLLASGVPLLESLSIVRSILGNEVLAKVVDNARDCIREGDSLSAPLKKSGEFPPLMVNMISSGERVGQLDTMLNNVANEFESIVNARVAALTSLLEPLMIVVMGGTIGFVVIAIMLPIMQLSDGFG